MSSILAKKVARTYSRQKKRPLYDEEPPTKRRRVETPAKSDSSAVLVSSDSIIVPRTSSPACTTSAPPTSSPRDSPAVFSDELPRSSPPSSPTPCSSPPALNHRRPVFGLLKRHAKPRTPTKAPLSERSLNAQSPQKQPSVTKRMVQMQLDLVGQHRKACKTCGMEYIPSNVEDAALHRKFHAINMGGVDFTKPVIERYRKTEVWSGGNGSFISVIGRKDALALRKRASDVLTVINTELAAVSIPDDELWGQAGRTIFADAPLEEIKALKAVVSAVDCQAPLVDRFKIYLYFQGTKCVGACLAERIWEAFTVIDQRGAPEQACQIPNTPQSSSISISTASEPAMLGISRIWTSKQCRKQGIASRLLETARCNFLYGMIIEKEQVAFSQPTESGGNLARKWFGRHAGWLVYID
ncbi:sister chromatid cohesion acetyltransferas-like protein Eco1 [Plenodomus tracheiphilus IPT5]|uniref:Sister chromatid cohesion acetyltransferas-like protein Eco1 n=1 Tax=Plenodomus tracheiphilus IPT5 TaxID=1408161 RepID=A0A6A7B184_9PLEO|nr:sister chromatid cohesion acetyltransferas-like protein Eco1 [Plenodomus tracheiphilus IPT5]